ETVPQQSLRPNWELAKITEAAKSSNLQRVREVEGGENLCEKHQEPLKLFCKDEEKLICVVCDRSKVHREHSVVPMDEAAQEYKVPAMSRGLEKNKKQQMHMISHHHNPQ
ncbi:PREDICTED: zinc finger protein RFP-like, partial [Pterocles gutturalis]|uniref:zinc finger protein RFP-like n=1 Tax=Pterocles gutturalis TaxID=240206 RepID=UPI0005280321